MEDKNTFGAEEILDIDELSKAAGGKGELAAWAEGIIRKELTKRKAKGEAMEDVIAEFNKGSKAPERAAMMADWIRQVWDTL